MIYAFFFTDPMCHANMRYMWRSYHAAPLAPEHKKAVEIIDDLLTFQL